jgi:hypothetical protein
VRGRQRNGLPLAGAVAPEPAEGIDLPLPEEQPTIRN